MKKILTIAFLITIFCLINETFGQPWLLHHDTEKYSFQTEREQFYKYWKDKTPEEGSGYNQFKRYEYFFESRLTEDNHLPPADMNYKAWVTHIRDSKVKGSRNDGSNWLPSGPSEPSNAIGYQNVGRVNCMAFHPTNSAIFWVGTPAGGIWKTTNGGVSWIPLTDDMPNLGVSGIAVDPDNPNIMYWATGDGDGRNTFTIGVLKSLDGGNTWNPTGFTSLLSAQHRIFKILMHPRDKNTLLIGTTNGIWKTINGGNTWNQTITSWWPDIEFHPTDPSTMFATSWYSDGTSRVYVSTNTGSTWVSKPVIAPNLGRISIAINPANPEKLYVMCTRRDNSGMEGFYESSDRANSFQKIFTVNEASQNLHGTYYSGDRLALSGQGTYNNSLIINPENPLEIYSGGVNTWKSTDGGKNWSINTFWNNNTSINPLRIQLVHADKHNFYYHPLIKNRLFDCNDGGLNYTDNNGLFWEDISRGLSISQIYRIAITEQNDQTVMTGLQDNGSKDLSQGVWTDVWGGDGMQCQIDPSDPNIKYAMSQNALSLVRTSNNWVTRSSILGSNPENGKGAWITPYVLAPQNPNRIYIGMKGFFKSDNKGLTWEILSDSLPSGLQFRHIVCHPTDTTIIYASTSFVIFKSIDGGSSWKQLISTSSRVITSLKIHENSPNELYMTQGNYTEGQHVFYSENGGQNWENITENLPNIPATSIAIHKVSNTIFVGTDLGVYVKYDQEKLWNYFSRNLPNTIVNDLKINYTSNTLWAGTYGRGLWSTALEINSATNEELYTQQIGLTIAPNPASEQIRIGLKTANAGNTKLSIIDIQGKTVMQHDAGFVTQGDTELTLNVSNLVDGLYFIKVEQGNRHLTGKLNIIRN